jgi:hypothetical protein
MDALQRLVGLVVLLAGWALGMAFPAACLYFVFRLIAVGPATRGVAPNPEDAARQAAEVNRFLKWFGIIAIGSLVWFAAALALLGWMRAMPAVPSPVGPRWVVAVGGLLLAAEVSYAALLRFRVVPRALATDDGEGVLRLRGSEVERERYVDGQVTLVRLMLGTSATLGIVLWMLSGGDVRLVWAWLAWLGAVALIWPGRRVRDGWRGPVGEHRAEA